LPPRESFRSSDLSVLVEACPPWRVATVVEDDASEMRLQCLNNIALGTNAIHLVSSSTPGEVDIYSQEISLTPRGALLVCGRFLLVEAVPWSFKLEI